MGRFSIGNGTNHIYDVITDQRDQESLMDVLEHQVIPMYYDRDKYGLPRTWVQYMKNSIATLAWRFSAHRMVADYVRHAYLPAAGGISAQMPR